MDTPACPDSITVAVHDSSSRAQRIRIPDLNGDAGGFGRPVVNQLARTTAVAHRTSGGRTFSADLARRHRGLGTLR
ncbi:hypothetical protein ACWEF9_38695 [Streptomyces sp. NPDC004980]